MKHTPIIFPYVAGSIQESILCEGHNDRCSNFNRLVIVHPVWDRNRPLPRKEKKVRRSARLRSCLLMFPLVRVKKNTLLSRSTKHCYFLHENNISIYFKLCTSLSGGSIDIKLAPIRLTIHYQSEAGRN